MTERKAQQIAVMNLEPRNTWPRPGGCFPPAPAAPSLQPKLQPSLSMAGTYLAMIQSSIQHTIVIIIPFKFHWEMAEAQSI